MKGSLSVSILNYLGTPKPLRFLSANQFYWLLVCSTSVFIGSLSVVAIAAQPEIAQVNIGDNINRPTLQLGSQGERVSELQAALKLLGFYSDAVNGIYNENTASAVSRFKQAVGLNPDGIVDTATWQRLFPNGPGATQTASSPNSVSNSTNSFPVPTQPSTVVPTQPVTTQAAGLKPEPRPITTQPAGLKPEPRPVTTQPAGLKPEPRPANRKPTTTPRTQTTPKKPAPPTRNTTTTRTNQIPGVQYTSEGLPILRPGMRNSEVTKLQQRLQKLGFLDGGIDGDFGPTTEAAVRAVQKRYGLEADGVVGGATWEILLQRSPRQR